MILKRTLGRDMCRALDGAVICMLCSELGYTTAAFFIGVIAVTEAVLYLRFYKKGLYDQ